MKKISQFLVFVFIICFFNYQYMYSEERTSGNKEILSCSGSFEEKHNYSLKISCEDAYNFNGVYYVRPNAEITIEYTPGRYDYSFSGGNEFGSGSYKCKCYTELEINEKKISAFNPFGFNPFKFSIIANMVIKFKAIKITNTGSANDNVNIEHEETLYILLDSECPSVPSITGGGGSWGKDNITISCGNSNDNLGIDHYEYKLKNASNWEKGGSYTTNVTDGSVLNGTIEFRAVDKVGNVSECASTTLLIDRENPNISSTEPEEKWVNKIITVNGTDVGSGVGKIYVDGMPYNNSYIIQTDGKHAVYVVDNVLNKSTTKYYWVDLESPEIKASVGVDKKTYFDDHWTNEDVEITVSDRHSGINTFTINEKKINEKKLLTETGIYEIYCTDNAENSSKRIVKIDKIKPVSQWNETTFNGFEYRTENERHLLNSITVNYSVVDEISGIKEGGNLLKANGFVIRDFSENLISYSDNSTFKELNRTEDCNIIYSVDVEDKATNHSDPISKTFTVPREIQLHFVNESDETQTIKRTRVINGYTTVGILFNKINFSLYEKIKLKRIFLGDKAENAGERNIIDYSFYKNRFYENVDEEIIRQKWELEQERIITENDVVPVTINGNDYWYYEDRINTDSGLGHKGIRYQAEWKWKEFDITEKGKYAEIDKTANNPGSVKIRLQGTNATGNEARYVVLDSDGERIENESDADFHIPVDGIVRISFKIEDEDTDEYNVQATEVIKAIFTDISSGNSEEHEITVPKEGFNSNGFIQKTMRNGSLVSEYRKTDAYDGWYEFDNPELKLYYNKPFNMKITMTEGCKGDSGKYKDITESVIIKLKAVNPDLGGFALAVGSEAGYNTDGITAQVHKIISLVLEEKGTGGQISNVEWNFGDGESQEGGSTQHAYGQSAYRTGNTSEYIMNIKFVQNQMNKQASINVHIVDTQSGTLLGNETWIGKHPVLNKLQIPYGVTLTIKENDKEPKNKTIILGIGSSDEERKGWIEVLSGGTLKVEEGDEKTVFAEGRNGVEFTEVKTVKDGGDDESLKWKGITLNNGAHATILNSEIKYAIIGLQLNNGSEVTSRKTKIRNCQFYGMKVEGNAITDGISVDSCETGLFITETGNLSASGIVKLNDCQNGILCDGILNAEKLDLKDIQKTGIRNNGTISIEEKISVYGTTFYGIRNEKRLFANSLKITASEGMGIAAGSGSITRVSITNVSAPEIGLHCTGTANADFGECNITSVIYGIKTDRDQNGGPSLSIKKGSKIEGAAVLWYDWKDGVLTDDEIKTKEN